MPQPLEVVKPGKSKSGKGRKRKIESSDTTMMVTPNRKSVGWELWEEAVKKASCHAVALSYLWEAVSIGRAVLKKEGKDVS